ncbi:MAG: elongation factor G [Ruminiclostridium sp.]|nr:elongation factor G [Ruminiclostridium sp.]
MKTYKCKNIRNIALLGHGGSGKTSVVEGLLYKCGEIERMGKVSDGSSVCDYDPEEIKRKVSLGTSLAYCQWKDVKINILDTPGQFDFAAGMYEGLSAAESAVIALPAKDGVQVGTIKAYREAVKRGKATMFVVTRMEEENSNFYKCLEELKTEFGPSICPIVVPFDKYGTVESYINLLEMKAYTYENGVPTEVEMPASENRLKGLRAAMAEAVAETDEELMMRFFENEGEDFTEAELVKGLHDGIDKGYITPVVCCSGDTLAGVDMMLNTIVYMLPSPDERGGELSANGEKIAYDETKPLAVKVFKTVADPFVGKMSYVKVVNGTLAAGASVYNQRTGETERLGKLLALQGKKSEEMIEAYAGDIIAVTKLGANTGDTLTASGLGVEFAREVFPEACYYKAVSAKNKNDEGKISNAIKRMIEEDLTLSYIHNHETHQRILGGLGEQHLDAVISKMKAKFGVDVEVSEPVIAYRESIRKKVSAEGKHKKQSGGHGQYGHVKIEFEPCDSETLIFEERVFGGSVPKNFFPAVEKGLQESMAHGVLAGYPVVNLKATLFDGSYHDVDSSEQAFKMAAHLAFKQGLPNASPCLLEPVCHVEIVLDDASTGDVMTVVNKRRGTVLGMNPSETEKGMTVLEATMPQAEITDLATVIRQITRGMGYFTSKFERYDQLPQALEADVIANAPKFSEYEG